MVMEIYLKLNLLAVQRKEGEGSFRGDYRLSKFGDISIGVRIHR